MVGGALAGAALSEFVGRDREVQAVRSLLGSRRLVTIVGPGGAGKTRLAFETTREQERVIVELAPVGDPRLVPGAILEDTGVHDQPPGDLLDVAAGMLAFEPVVLVLDNCEHLRGAVADAAARLLAACPDLRILATSRAALGVSGEVTWSIPPLDDADAVRLFDARAADARPDHAPHDVELVRAICRDLDGMPLAIELAAARTRMLTAREIADGLSDRLRLLAAPVADESRHVSMRRSLDWSHALLSAPQQILFRRLSVFAGGWALADAEAVCADELLARKDVFDAMAGLVEQSLVLADQDDGATRYRMLESMRAYAAERLADADEATAFGRRHLDLFLAIARSGRDVDAEEGNVRAAIGYALRHDPPDAVRLATAWRFWWIAYGRYREGVDTLERALAALDGGVSAAEHASALAASAYLAHHAGEFALAHVRGEEALALAEESGDAYAIGVACMSLGNAVAVAQRPDAGVPLLERAVALLAEAAPNTFAVFHAAGSLAANCLLCDRIDRALEAGEMLRELTFEGFESYRAGWIDAIPGQAGFQQGRFADAIGHAERALAGEPRGGTVSRATAFAAWALARTHIGEGESSLEAVLEEIARARRRGAQFGLARLQFAAATAELACGAIDEAVARSRDWCDAGHVVMAASHREVLCRAALAREDAVAARGAGSELRTVADEIGAPLLLATADHVLGRAALLEGEWRVARERLHAALETFDRLGSAWRACDTLEALCALSLEGDDGVGAARLLGAVDAERARLGHIPVPPEPAWRDGLRARARDLAGAGHDDASAEGAALALSDAIAWARRMRGPRARAVKGWASLTPVEAKVAELAAQGLTNPQIGERLFVSRGTVKVHLSRVFAKLELSNRAELIALVAQRSRT